MKPWQRGYEIEGLQALARPFAEHDDGLILGAFSRVNEARIAEWLEKQQLVTAERATACCRVLRRRQTVRDFRRVAAVELPEGCALVDRLGYGPGGWDDALGLLRGLQQGAPVMAAWLWQEHPGDRALAKRLGLRLLAVKIRASSEIVGLWGDPRLEPAPLPARERTGLARLRLPPLPVEPLAQAVDQRGLAWEPHYSGYNERGSWEALALRGFGGQPELVEKPAEMSKRWKAEHPERLADACEDTPLRARLPEAEPLIAAVPGPKERIRLMRLRPGGALGRHADITDPEAGADEGQLLRIHVPVETNPGVTFSSWRPSGERDEAHMGLGEAWWLDTRKPHAAANRGAGARTHLVMDVRATPELFELLPC